MKRPNFSNPTGFALVVTLAMVVLAVVIAVALLTHASLDRLTATSYDHRFEAELAARNGLEAAKKALSTDGNGNSITGNDHFVVIRIPSIAGGTPASEDTTPHYYFIGQTDVGSGNVKYFPLFSGGGTPQTVAATSPPTFTALNGSDPRTATNLPFLLPDPATSSSSAPPLLPPVTTQWVEVNGTDPPPTPMLRYCFWIEDLAGYIDADTAGNTFGKDSLGNLDKTHTRDPGIMQPLIDAGTAKTTSLIAMWTLFNSTATTDVSGSAQDQDNQSIVSQRGILFTSETTKQAIVSSSSAAYLGKISRHIVAGTRRDSEQLIIPYSFNYANEGQKKTDLNAKITSKDVNGIADAIKTNLPNWASSRRGGFGANLANANAMDDSYRRTLAANIIGYAQPTKDAPAVGIDYRGLGAYPLVNEFYDYLNWTAVSSSSITVEITSWVELWNITNQTISGTVRYTDYYRHQLDLGVYTYFDDNHDPENPAPGETVSGIPYASQTVTMAPNEFKVLKFGPASYTLSTGGTIPASPLTLQFTKTGRYKLEWQSDAASSFVKVDEPGQQPLGGIQMATDKIYNPQESSSKVPYKWNGSLPGFSYYGGVANFYYNPGDPRSAFYNAAPLAANDYSNNATMWSRNAKPSSSKVIGQEVQPSRWADGGHNTALISPAGLKDTVSPSTSRPGNAPAIDPTKAPAVISNAGNLKSIAELGNIYDPAQWNMSTAGDRWTDIDSSATSDSRYGGGFTLRVGRPEFTLFDQTGSRGSQLLDIFSLGTRRESQGLVNLNTATRETLRALGAGLLFNRDPDILPVSVKDNLYPPTASDQADKFADALIAARNGKPFISTAQLAKLRDSSNVAFFGNQQQWSSPQTAPTEWNDVTAEDYFARVLDLSTVRSRNFRVFVTGQYVDPRYPDAAGNPKVLATAKKIYHVFLSANRAGDGSIQSQQMDVTYERDL